MSPIFSSKSQKRKERRAQIATALDEFINSIYWGEDLRPAEARKNLEYGIIEITCGSSHAANGLLITEDGYFITPKHCLSEEMKEKKIRLFTTEKSTM
jgi:hypothetical protein